MKLSNSQLLAKAIKAHQEGNFEEAEKLYQQVLKNEPNQFEANNNLAIILEKSGRLEEARSHYEKLVKVQPKHLIANYNLAVLFEKAKNLNEAEKYYKKTLELKPDFTEAYFNLSILLNKLDKIEEAEKYFQKTLELKPDFAEAYNGLGNILFKLNKFEEAEIKYKKAIELKPKFPNAYSNLGSLLEKLHRLDEAEVNCMKAIKLKPDFAEAYYNFGHVVFKLNRIDEAYKSYEKAIELKPDYIDAQKHLKSLFKIKKLALKIEQVRKINAKKKSNYKIVKNEILETNPFISKRIVEKELIKKLYDVKSKNLDETTEGIFYGKGKHSVDFALFELLSKNNDPVINKVVKDLVVIMRESVNSEIFIMDSFFNILKGGGGSKFHDHINQYDRNNKLINQKYSLTYHLAVGDQNSSEPGILKFKNPDEEILPSEGMIMIFPADRQHSAIYNGKKDRVMIGINFYSLI